MRNTSEMHSHPTQVKNIQKFDADEMTKNTV